MGLECRGGEGAEAGGMSTSSVSALALTPSPKGKAYERAQNRGNIR